VNRDDLLKLLDLGGAEAASGPAAGLSGAEPSEPIHGFEGSAPATPKIPGRAVPAPVTSSRTGRARSPGRP
jgi:hypothetical protein